MGKLKGLFIRLVVLVIVFNVFLFPLRVNAINRIDQDRLSNCVVLYIGSPNSYVNSVKAKIDSENPRIVPFVKNGRTLVPVRFISESLYADVDWDGATSTVTISLNENIAVLKPGQNSMLLNNEEKELDVPAEIIEGRTYLPLRRLVEDVLDKNIFYDRNLIIISEKDNSFDKEEDKSLIDDLLYIYGKNSAITHITGGIDHTAAIKEDGSVWVWGDLGDRNVSVPEMVYGLDRVIEVSAGNMYTLALQSDGTVWTWGETRTENGESLYRQTPVRVEKLNDIKKISAAYDGFCLALKGDGTVWSWQNDMTQIKEFEPSVVEGLSNIVDIAAESNNSFAIDGDGAVWVLSEDKGGVPEKVEGISDVIDISAGLSHVLALKKDGTVWIWKYNDPALVYGGQEEGSDLSVPIQVKELSGIVAISARGGGHSIALKEDGSMYLWGVNWYKSGSNYLLPVAVSELSDVREIASGNGHILALKSDGSVWAFGDNGNGQIGDGTFIIRTKPVLSLFELNPLKINSWDMEAESKLVYEFDGTTNEVLDSLVENIMSENTYYTYESFTQRDRMDMVFVDNARDFINAIRPNCEIILKSNGVYNLLDPLYGVMGSKYVYVNSYGLIVEGVENLIIRSESGIPVNVKSPDLAHVLKFKNCKNIMIDGINAVSEINRKELLSEVLSFENCQNIYLNNLVLSGGSYGIALANVNGFVFGNSVIEDCKVGIMNILDSKNIIFNGSKFRNTTASSDLVNIMSSKNILFTACEISNNQVASNGGNSKYQLFNTHFVEPILLVKDTVIKNNKADYMRVYEDDIYFGNVTFENNDFIKGVYESDR